MRLHWSDNGGECRTLPETGSERLAFFQDYFEDADPLLAGDSYDEFAKAPYADVTGLKDRLPHDKLLAWIKKPEVSTSRRRLYLTLLGVCGGADDVPELETMIRQEDRQLRSATSTESSANNSS